MRSCRDNKQNLLLLLLPSLGKAMQINEVGEELQRHCSDWPSHRQSGKHWNCFKGYTEETCEGWGGVYNKRLSQAQRYPLDWDELFFTCSICQAQINTWYWRYTLTVVQRCKTKLCYNNWIIIGCSWIGDADRLKNGRRICEISFVTRRANPQPSSKHNFCHFFQIFPFCQHS